MEHQPAMSWPEQLHENHLMTGSGEDEFSNFLEFNMHFPDLEGHGPAHPQLPEQEQSMVQPTIARTSAAAAAATSVTTMPSDMQSLSYATPMEGLAMEFGNGAVSSHAGPMPYSTPSMTPGFCAQDSSHQPSMSQQQPSSGQNYMQGQHMIPPTPNSIELHGNAARYPHRMDDNQEMYDRYSRINEEQVCLVQFGRVPLVKMNGFTHAV